MLVVYMYIHMYLYIWTEYIYMYSNYWALEASIDALMCTAQRLVCSSSSGKTLAYMYLTSIRDRSQFDYVYAHLGCENPRLQFGHT